VPAEAARSEPDVLALFADADYAQHRNDLRALVQEAQGKGLRVERVVRVACPARGTLLASKRLDAYLSVLTWSLQLASVPVAPQLLDFLHEVARRRAEPEELPGLEAMMPGRPMVDWLNRAEEPIPATCASSPATWKAIRSAPGSRRCFGRLLLDRQRPRRADALDVRRLAAGAHGERQRCQLRAGPRRQGLALHYFANDRTVRRSPPG
jgi:hypothetical protein